MVDIKRQEEAFDKIQNNYNKSTLIEIGDIITGKTPSTKDLSLWNGGIPFITPTDMNGNKYINTERTVSNKYLESNYILPKNSVCFTSIASIGKMCMTKECSITNQQINSIIPHNRNSNEFIYYFLTSRVNKIKSTVSSHGMAMINKTDFSLIKIKIPSYRLQCKIANLLTSLDLLIQKQEEYIEELKVQKKGYSQNIFSQKLRFNGFKDDWNNKKLGEISSISTGNKDVKDANDFGKYNFYIRSKNIMKINSYSYDGEAILIGGDGKIEELIHYFNGKFDYHQRVYKISDFDNIYGRYLFEYINKFIGKQLMKDSAKTTVDSVRRPSLVNFEVYYPSLKEQQKIGDFLSTLDDKIELQEQKLEQLKLKKKYYLNKIFQ